MASVADSVTGVAMDVDSTEPSHALGKRKTEDLGSNTSKKAKTGELLKNSLMNTNSYRTSRTCHCVETVRLASYSLQHHTYSLTSDRENCTVFVDNLPKSTEETDLRSLFKDVCRDFQSFPDALLKLCCSAARYVSSS